MAENGERKFAGPPDVRGSERAMDGIRKLNNDVDEKMYDGDRAGAAKLHADTQPQRKSYREKINQERDYGYSPEGMPRTYKNGGMVKIGKSSTPIKVKR